MIKRFFVFLIKSLALLILLLMVLFFLFPLTVASIVIPPCQTEDSGNCYWDADEQGNGRGRSFVVIGNDYVFYVE